VTATLASGETMSQESHFSFFPLMMKFSVFIDENLALREFRGGKSGSSSRKALANQPLHQAAVCWLFVH
jgi:hypothetical protein